MDIFAYQEIPMTHFITLSAFIFVIGFAGIFLNRKNIINFLLSLELILLAANINFVSFATRLNDLTGQVFVMFILTVAAAEIAIGLAILITYFRQRGSIDLEEKNIMKG
jgi:NADH-quinone oxidoreductase subunit K